jgi:type II secretory pathway pseudopilin PulG
MKLTFPPRRSGPLASGMTLIELTVVILVLLALISTLFIGARAWKRGSDRAGCIMNIRKVQQAVRSFANLSAFNPGQNIAPINLQNALIGVGQFVESTPECPGSGSYTFGGNVIPATGTLYMNCDLAVSDEHVPGDISAW